MGVYELVQQWKQANMFHTITLREAARELEKAWHEDWHDGAWSPENCRVCVEEMKAEGISG